MKKTLPIWFLPTLLVSALTGCDIKRTREAPPLTASKDFWIDRCDITFRGKPFPVTGTVDDMVRLLGTYDRLDTLGSRYFWDSLGLEVNTFEGIGQIRSLDIHFAHEESDSEIGLRLAGRPEDSVKLADIRSTYPHGFFNGEMVLEGATIGPEIDFQRVNDTRAKYLESQSGPDAHVIAIQQSWSSTRYAYERTCADGKQFGFLFTLLSSVAPLRMQSLSIDSDNVPDSLYMPDASKPVEPKTGSPKPAG